MIKPWPKLKINNKFIYENSIKEKKYYMKTPAIIKKLKNVPGGVYWLTLGKLKFKDYKFYFERFKTAIIWRLSKLIGKQRIWPFLFLPHYQVLAHELLPTLLKKITKNKK